MTPIQIGGVYWADDFNAIAGILNNAVCQFLLLPDILHTCLLILRF